MNIECPSCGRNAKISDQLVDQDGLEVTCPECSVAFVVMPGGFTTEKEGTRPESKPGSSEGDSGSFGGDGEIRPPEDEQAETGRLSEEKEGTGQSRPVEEALRNAAEQGIGEVEVPVEDLSELEESRREFLLCHLVPRVESGGPELAEVLIELGTDPDAKDEEGKPALHHVASNGKPEVARVLLENGAGADERGYAAKTSIHCAARANSEDVAEILIEAGAEVDAPTERNGSTALHLAASEDNIEVARVLLDAGADPDARTAEGYSEGNTPLHSAVSSESVDVAKALIEAGSDVNARNCKEETPLHPASVREEVEILNLLLQNDADVGVRDQSGASPLGSTLQIEKDSTLDVVEVLVESGADLDSGGTLGGTPLHAAAFSCGPEVVEYLIEAGADVNATNEYGKTPLDQVEYRSNEGDPDPRVGRLLKREGAKRGKDLSQNSPQGCLWF